MIKQSHSITGRDKGFPFFPPVQTDPGPHQVTFLSDSGASFPMRKVSRKNRWNSAFTPTYVFIVMHKYIQDRYIFSLGCLFDNIFWTVKNASFCSWYSYVRRKYE
jgi:hypothetical protein